jgi:Cu-processing system permease protein
MTRIRAIAWAVWMELLRRKDVYVLLILLGALLLTLVSLDIFGLGGTSRYVKDVGLLFSWIFGWILSIHIAARELPQEEERGTIFPLLARPVTRMQVVIGKWLGAWSIVVCATLLFYLLVAGVSLGMGGRMNGMALLQGFLLHSIVLGIFSALALAFSTRLNHDAAATLSFVLTGAIYLLIPRIPVFLVQQKGVRGIALLVLYHLMPHFDLFDLRMRIVHDFGPAHWGTCAAILIYGLLWIGFLLVIACLAYGTKQLSRGAAYR